MAPHAGEPRTIDVLLAEYAETGAAERLEELYARLAPALYGWASLRIQDELQTRIDPEDIVQETWFRALRVLDRFDPARAAFRTWIFGLAKNVLLEALRAVRRIELAGMDTTTRVFALENVPDSVTSITRRVAREEALQRFLARVRELGEDEQTLTILCGLEGLGCDQAARRLGISHEAAVKRWQRLRSDLATLVPTRELLAEEMKA
jgi:RNA polymerase sigma-70 factor (ECF subfamily)